jgi:hypothetical protein
MLWLGTDNWGAILLIDEKEENGEEKDGENEPYDLTKEEDYAVDQSTEEIENTEIQSEKERESENYRHENLTETLVKSPVKKNSKKQNEEIDSDDKYDEFAFLDNLLDGKQDKKSRNKNKKDDKSKNRSNWRYDDDDSDGDEDEDEEDEEGEGEGVEEYDDDEYPEQSPEEDGNEILQVRKHNIGKKRIILVSIRLLRARFYLIFSCHLISISSVLICYLALPHYLQQFV